MLRRTPALCCWLVLLGIVLAGAPMPEASAQAPEARVRARELGIAPGVLAPGPLNAITDVDGVRVGQVTIEEGPSTRTGVTAILPHDGNLFQEKVPAGLFVLNGFGKLAGATQLRELGEIETPIVLTNTLAVGRAVEAVVDWTLEQPGNDTVRSVNAVVGETNDGYLNDIRSRGVTPAHVRAAIERATTGPVQEGSVGAGTGTMALGWKGGIGTSSRRLPPHLGGYTVGVLAQTNFGGDLRMDGVPVGRMLGRYYLRDELEGPTPDGSVMIVLATDAPLSDRNLTRLARRAAGGLARTGAALSNGSGDYMIAFSTADQVRRTPERRATTSSIVELPNDRMSPLFVAASEATEEAILNSLMMATTVTSKDPHSGATVVGEAIDLAAVRAALARARNGGSAR